MQKQITFQRSRDASKFTRRGSLYWTRGDTNPTLQEGDISIDFCVRTCVDEEGADAVLEVISHDVIKEYCIQRDINIELNYFDQISDAVKEFTVSEKAMLICHQKTGHKNIISNHLFLFVT